MKIDCEKLCIIITNIKSVNFSAEIQYLISIISHKIDIMSGCTKKYKMGEKCKLCKELYVELNEEESGFILEEMLK